MEKNKKIYLIGNSHIDPVWQWVWQEGFSEIKATWRSTLDRMKEFPHYKFTSACSSYYMWIEKSDPEMFNEIKQRVKEGRWCIVGGQFIQPDCNIPCGEAFARHSLISQRYFKEKFGIYAKTGYNVDSFGHNGNMPLILKNSKMDNYVFMRPDKNEKNIPQAYFKWQSADGSTVNTFRLAYAYCLTMVHTELLKNYPQMDEPTDLMAFYGVGNHGGGPTIEMLNWMKENLGEDYIYATPDEFFESTSQLELPVLKDDLQFHAKGCYSAVSKVKADNRRAENNILAAEKYSVLSETLIKTPYEIDEINRAWKNILFNQFHDVLGGCCLKEAYDDAAYSYGESMSIAQRVTNFALQQISWNIDTTNAACPDELGNVITKHWKEWGNIKHTLVVFNPHDHEIDALIPVRKYANLITDNKGNVIPWQYIRDTRNASTEMEGKYLIAFNTTLSPLGYKVFRLWADNNGIQPTNSFNLSDTSIENNLIKITFDINTAELCGIFDKQADRELLGNTSDSVLVDETEFDTWAHGVKEFKQMVAKAQKASISLIESGPVRSTIRTEQIIGESKIIKEYSLRPDDKRIYIKARVEFYEKHRMLKFCYPVAVSMPKAFCEIPFGYIERPTDGSEQPMQSWCAIKDENTGLVIANDSKYSFDADENTLSLTVLRTPLYCDHCGNNGRDSLGEYTDQGIHEFEYVLFPFESFSDCKKKSDELNVKPICLQETFHEGTLPNEYSAIDISAENVTLTAIKKSEDEHGTILRFEELEGKDTEFTVRFFENIIKLKINHNSVLTISIDKFDNVTVTDFIE